MSGQTQTALSVVRGAGVPIALNADGSIPDWIMLLPAGNDGVIATVDGRGPYRVGDLAQLASASLDAVGGQLLIDENHATDIAAPRGGESPARAWVAELQVRGDGLYGRAEWNAAGKALMADRAYRFISPVIAHDKAGNVKRLLRASLTNTPNLRGMAALHAETNMDLLAQLRKLLGLGDDADEAAVLAKIKSWTDSAKTAMQAALAPIAKAAGCKDDADATAIATAVTALAARPATDQSTTITALQSELATVTTKLNELTAQTAKDKATAFVDGEIAKQRVGLKPLRDHYIARHAASAEGAAQVEKEISAMPILGPSGLPTTPPEIKDGKIALNAEQLNAANMLGISPQDYEKTLAAERAAS
jgi:phage I-like protein